MEGASVMVEPKPKNRLFNKAISGLRRIAQKTSDLELSLGALTVVAGVTGEDADTRLALERAHGPGNGSIKAKSLAVLVRILAEERKFPWAREVAIELSGMDNYWYAIARVWIARFSVDNEDVDAAEQAVQNITASEVRVEVVHDMANLLSEKYHRAGTARDVKFYELLTALARSLTKLKGFEDDAHRVRPEHTSAHFHLEAESIIDSFFADLMDQ